jgi:hypothetical protein
MTVGQVLSASQTASQKAASLQRAVLTPSGKRQPLEDEGSDAVELTEQGFYELRSAGNGAETDVAVVASNVDPAEADLTPMDAKELVTAALGAPEAAQGGPGAGVAMTPQAQEKNQKLWWYLMCAGIVLLGVETVLSNRMAKA